MTEYEKADFDAYMKFLHKNAVGHLCFECRRQLQADDMVSINLVGGLPIYHHSCCIFSEDRVQQIIEGGQREGLIYG